MRANFQIDIVHSAGLGPHPEVFEDLGEADGLDDDWLGIADHG
jgi:hypothetical protein